MILVIFSKLLIVLYYVWVAISAILWLVCPSAVLSFIIVLLLI